jgi:hypothetical protein
MAAIPRSGGEGRGLHGVFRRCRVTPTIFFPEGQLLIWGIGAPMRGVHWHSCYVPHFWSPGNHDNVRFPIGNCKRCYPTKSHATALYIFTAGSSVTWKWDVPEDRKVKEAI